MRRISQKTLDRWFPTLVRYVGVGLMVYAGLTSNAALIAAATGMLLFKTVYGDGSKD